MSSCAATEGHRLLTKVFVLGGRFELERRVPYAQCVAFIVRCFFGARCIYLQGEQAQHHVFCVAAESVAWRTRGRRVEGHGTFRGTVVEGEDARSKCWVLYNNDGISGGAATRLSMMLNGRWSAEHARSHERHAGRAKQCDRGCRWWQRKHAAAAAAFFYALRGRD